MMRDYELIALLKVKESIVSDSSDSGVSEDSEAEAPKVNIDTSCVDTILQRYNAEVTKREVWGEKRLHHPIKNITKAFFIYRSCRLEAPRLKELEHEMHLNAQILRFVFKRVKQG